MNQPLAPCRSKSGAAAAEEENQTKRSRSTQEYSGNPNKKPRDAARTISQEETELPELKLLANRKVELFSDLPLSHETLKALHEMGSVPMTIKYMTSGNKLCRYGSSLPLIIGSCHIKRETHYLLQLKNRQMMTSLVHYIWDLLAPLPLSL